MTATGLTQPSTIRLGLARGRVELIQFFRNKESAIFSFGLPALLLVLLGSIFRGSYDHPGVSASQVFAASMIAYGIVSTAFITMGVGIAVDREDGTLKRLRGTPINAAGYLLGKLILVAVASLAEVLVLLAVGVLVFDMPLPSGFARWSTFGALLALSVTVCTLLGVAASGLARSARSAPAVMTVPVVALQFLSGIFVHPITMLPPWMVTVASVFPVKWMGQGFRSVFLPDSMTQLEAGGSWEPDRTALVLTAWCVVGLVACLVTFRWTDRADR
jgi:ABC-2 type transport system permease protein